MGPIKTHISSFSMKYQIALAFCRLRLQRGHFAIDAAYVLTCIPNKNILNLEYALLVISGRFMIFHIEGRSDNHLTKWRKGALFYLFKFNIYCTYLMGVFI